MKALIRRLAIVAVLMSLAGCATVDFDYPKQESVAMAITATADTYLGKQLTSLVSAHADGESGFHPLADGVDALAVRLLMAERAEQTIDAQYYLLKNGITGRAFVHSLLQAADRGVRVRLLLDDMFTSGYDA